MMFPPEELYIYFILFLTWRKLDCVMSTCGKIRSDVNVTRTHDHQDIFILKLSATLQLVIVADFFNFTGHPQVKLSLPVDLRSNLQPLLLTLVSD